MTPTENPKDWLVARRDQLLARMAGIEQDLETHDTRDWEDLATEREDDQVLEGMADGARHELRMIDAALSRIAANEYGFCTRCGDAIGADRLAAVPWTPLCRSCATAR